MQFAGLHLRSRSRQTHGTNECQYPMERNNSTNRAPNREREREREREIERFPSTRSLSRSLIPYFLVQLFSHREPGLPELMPLRSPLAEENESTSPGRRGTVTARCTASSLDDSHRDPTANAREEASYRAFFLPFQDFLFFLSPSFPRGTTASGEDFGRKRESISAEERDVPANEQNHAESVDGPVANERRTGEEGGTRQTERERERERGGDRAELHRAGGCTARAREEEGRGGVRRGAHEGAARFARGKRRRARRVSGI